MRQVGISWVTVAVLVGACQTELPLLFTPDARTAGCEPGATLSCSCQGGRAGTRVCGEERVYGACRCAGAPTASGTTFLTARRGEPVVLDASASRDPDGDTLEYLWLWVSRPAGSHTELSDAYAVRPTLVPDRAGDYQLLLAVSDGQFVSEAVPVTVSVSNFPPSASISANLAPHLGTVELTTGAYDLDGDPVTVRWELLERPPGSAAAFDDPTSPVTRLTIDRFGSYRVRLIASDGAAEASAEEVLVAENRPPVAQLDEDRVVITGTPLSLDARASSDEDGQALGYRWTMVARPPGSAAALAGASGPTPSFTPDVDGRYTLRLVVTDGLTDGAAVERSVTSVERNLDLVGGFTFAEYSRSVDRVVIVSDATLRLVDLAGAPTVEIPLAGAVTAFALAPDGRSAAAGHQDGLSIVSLDSARVLVRHLLAARVDWLALNDDFAFLYQYDAGPYPMSAVERTTGAVHVLAEASSYAFTMAGDGRSLYLYNNTAGRKRAADSTMADLYTFADGRVVGPLYRSEDGAQLFTGTGAVLASAGDAAHDLAYLGAIEGVQFTLRHLHHSAAAGLIAVVTGGSVLDVTLHDATYRALLQRIPPPPLYRDDPSYPAAPLHAFIDARGTRLGVIYANRYEGYGAERHALIVTRLGAEP